jgi:hypothetical protein
MRQSRREAGVRTPERSRSRRCAASSNDEAANQGEEEEPMKTKTMILIAAVVCAAAALVIVGNKYNGFNDLFSNDKCVHDCWKDGVRIR